MAFSIELLDELAPDPQSGRLGLITIGSFVERFVAAIEYWDVTQYHRHWQQAIIRTVQGAATSALITSMHDPAAANFVHWWPMYRLGDAVHFQNHILLLYELKIAFDPNDPFRFVPERIIINSQGERVSEWSASISELECYLVNS